MFNLQTYISPIILSYVDKYVRDFKPADAQVSLWEGGVALHNLVLKPDVLQQEVSLPFTLVSGRIHELLIQVPWTKIISEPIVVTINTIECVLNLNPPADGSPTHKEPRTQVVEAPPGYMQALVRRIVSNIAVRVNSLIVKYVQDDIVLSLNVKKLSVDSVGSDWKPLFFEINPICPILRRLVHLDDLTLCLDKTDADGKIRYYQEPLLYRCQLDLRVFTRLVSATKRRASSLSIHLNTNKLAWSVTSDQLVLLTRLCRERPTPEASQQPPKPPTPSSSAQSAAVNQPGTWTEWAWSWLPSFEREGVQQTPDAAIPVPITFTAYFEHMSFVFKIMEDEGTKKRPRAILELKAADAVMRIYSCFPTSLRIQFATRYLTLLSNGKCVCGHVDYYANRAEQTIYLSKVRSLYDGAWVWKDEDIGDQSIVTPPPVGEPAIDPNNQDESTNSINAAHTPPSKPGTDSELFWDTMVPVVYLSYGHERYPPANVSNPYENPPRVFEYSDWVESSVVKLKIKPMLFQISTGFIHRMSAFLSTFQDLAPSEIAEPRCQTLTVEELEALSGNLPLRQMHIEIKGMSVRFHPWDHNPNETGVLAPMSLDIEFPESEIHISGPLYPHRVCSAACQMPDKTQHLVRYSMVNVSAMFSTVLFGIVTTVDEYVRACGRADFSFAFQYLLYHKYFKQEEAILMKYTFKISELNICGSAQRLIVAVEVALSLFRENSVLLKETSLPRDILIDEDTPALDVSLEGFVQHGVVNNITHSHFTTVQSVRATIFQNPDIGTTKQAWLLCAPQDLMAAPFLRVSMQFCHDPSSLCLEYVGVWMEPTAMSIDPLLVAWLSYSPKFNRPASPPRSPYRSSVKNVTSTRGKATPPSSSGRGGSQSDSAEVHVKPQSVASTSEQSEVKETSTQKEAENNNFMGWSDEDLLKLYRRLNRLLMTVEIGIVSLYVVDVSASAVNCATIRESMDSHAAAYHNVVVYSVGRLSINSNSEMRHMWQKVKPNQATFLKFETHPNQQQSFPWKIRVADVTCYVLYDSLSPGRLTPTKKSPSHVSRSPIKHTRGGVPVTLLDMVTTTITATVVKKTLPIIYDGAGPSNVKKTEGGQERSSNDNTNFFTSGVDFKPSSLKEFFRGPLRIKKPSPEPDSDQASLPTPPTFKRGPVVSLGINLHADTKPLIIRMDNFQLEAFGMSIHCIVHMVHLLRNYPPAVIHMKWKTRKNSPKVAKSSKAETEKKDNTEDTPSEKTSEALHSIYEANTKKEPPKLNTFIWLQWVIGRAAVVISSREIKLAFNFEEVMSSFDIQKHYNQLKMKIGAASIRHYVLNNAGEWMSDVLGGRILEVREPTDATEENHFLSLTVTKAQVSNLPASWKEELHPKLLKKDIIKETVLEVFATLAPLEAVLQPTVMDLIISWLHKVSPTKLCSLKEVDKSPVVRHWPFLFITSGGIRLILPSEVKTSNIRDDTFILMISKITVSPQPDNPFCRRPAVPGANTDWPSARKVLEDRQYEIKAKSLTIRSAKFRDLIFYEEFLSELANNTSGENPALKWSQVVEAPVITPVLHPVDVSYVFAPPAFNKGELVYGPAVEVNILSDCTFEINLERLDLLTETIQALRRRYMRLTDLEEDEKCPFSDIVMRCDSPYVPVTCESESRLEEESERRNLDSSQSMGGDSGVDTASTSMHCTRRQSDVNPDPSEIMGEYMELLIIMGVIEVSLYVTDDGSAAVKALRPPTGWDKSKTEPVASPQPSTSNAARAQCKEEDADINTTDTPSSKSVTDNMQADIRKNKLELPTANLVANKAAGNVPLLHITLQQPNLYFLRKHDQKSLQVTLFNLWVGIGSGRGEGNWNIPLISTAQGTIDHVTHIPPALLIMRTQILPRLYRGRMCLRGTVNFDIDRPVMFEVSSESLIRLKGTIDLVQKHYAKPKVPKQKISTKKWPMLYELWKNILDHNVESIIIQTSQIGIRGNEGVVGWDTAKIQLAAGARPDTIFSKILISAFVVSATSAKNRRHVVLQPVMLGLSLKATWDSWRKVEKETAFDEPTITIGIEFDRTVFDLRPSDFAIVDRLQNTWKEMVSKMNSNLGTDDEQPSCSFHQRPENPNPSCSRQGSNLSSADLSDYYKDDLRSGAFLISSGPLFIQPYQLSMHGSIVSWRYPQPRAITRVIAYPIPDHDVEVQCVLESYSEILMRWESHKYFKLPVSEARELVLNITSNDVTFSSIWRVRAFPDTEDYCEPYQFDFTHFLPQADPLVEEYLPGYDVPTCSVTAEQLSGVLRIDSYFAPPLLPIVSFGVCFTALELNAYNNLPKLTKEGKTVDGYFVSRPIMRSHRVMSLALYDVTGHALFGHTNKFVFAAKVSSDVVDTATGTMEPFVDEFQLQGAVTMAEQSRVRLHAGDIRVFLHVPRVRTLLTLMEDWQFAYQKYIIKNTMESKEADTDEEATATVDSMEGRVSLWVHNSCSLALRVGQASTDEVLQLGAGATLAYRWRCPKGKKQIRFATGGNSINWSWSASVLFAAGSYRVLLEDYVDCSPGSTGAHLYVTVKESGSRLDMYLSGRLWLANMMRFDLFYKVRSASTDPTIWPTISAGRLGAETVCTSVLCSDIASIVLKLKLSTEDLGWSGDIPIKECRKENVPWLVKVPCKDKVPFMSVWCRVIRSRGDDRLIAMVWPFYVLRSHLPLDAEVTINTEAPTALDVKDETQTLSIVQTAQGRGACTHLRAPGTTAARHVLNLQYMGIDCPITGDPIPLHYGVTETSVFDKPTPTQRVEDIIAAINDWLARSSEKARSPWPYSIVANHWDGEWLPPSVQPRTDVAIRYSPVRVGGGCSLELQLCPMVLLVNAAPIALTLRAHDAAPLCKLDPGMTVSLATVVLKKPYFISIEIGRETFVSPQLQISSEEPGRYGNPPPGQVALDRASNFAVHCNHKVVLLTMYYEIKEEINILGLSTTYVLFNKLKYDILYAALVLPEEVDRQAVLVSKELRTLMPTITASVYGTPLCNFTIHGRWRGGDVSELRPYLCLTLDTGDNSAHDNIIPVRLGTAPVRRAIALPNHQKESIPIVVTQVCHDGRWAITIGEDPCPQFFIHNRTNTDLAIAEPLQDTDDESSASPRFRAVDECPGTRWWCTVEARSSTHYTTPAHCIRFPPINAQQPNIPFLTVGHAVGTSDPQWCQPVAMADGEQLLQLAGNHTIKVRVRTHPHSTLVEFLEVDQNDISASDIRRRLQEPFLSSDANLRRVSAEDKHVDKPTREENSTALWEQAGPSTKKDEAQPSVVVQKEESVYDENVISTDLREMDDSSLMKLSNLVREDITDLSNISHIWLQNEQLGCIVNSITVTVAASSTAAPLLSLHLQRAALVVKADARKIKSSLSILEMQVDNAQYDSGQYDFAVVATARATPVEIDAWPPFWGIFNATFKTYADESRLLIHLCHERWTVGTHNYQELTEVDIAVGPLALYVEDSFINAAVELFRLARPAFTVSPGEAILLESAGIQYPLRLRKLHLRPLNLTLTLHTAVRMYIALDESPLRLSAFELRDVMTSSERLTHALTVHYLSAAILGAGWVVGGLELLGAPGALAARVGGATGGVRGVASAAAAALLKSLSAWAGSLARNLDLLAGDEEHAKRAAAARRHPPSSLVAGLVAGATNFAINILGAVGGLAHHPLVGVAVGETESGTAALRRGLLGAIAKPLSATADLVAYAGQGLLTQTGWDPVPQPRSTLSSGLQSYEDKWRRDCVRWSFRLSEFSLIAGFEVLLDEMPLLLLITYKFLVIVDPENERVVEMVDMKSCRLGRYDICTLQLKILRKRPSNDSAPPSPEEEENEYQVNAAAMERVARYTGAEETDTTGARVLTFEPDPETSNALFSLLSAALHNNSGTHFSLL